MTPRPQFAGLSAQLMAAQVVVIAVGATTLALTAKLVAPGVFRRHLARGGVTAPPLRLHIEEALASSLGLSLTVAALASLLTAGIASWVLVRRIARPVEHLAQAADAVTSGRYDLNIPTAPAGSELARLSEAFSHMGSRLADIDAARSRMLADLSHELRTPLATLSAYIDAMEDGVVPADATSFTTMRSQVSRLRRLATDVRTVAVAQEDGLDLQLSVNDPFALAQAAIEAAAPGYAARGITLTSHVIGPPTTIQVDPHRIGQVLANLLDNASRHTPTDGHVDLSVDTRRGRVVVQVHDDGAGIPPDQTETIFNRLHRADPSRSDDSSGGNGLGLTIARAIVRAHQGTLTATSSGLGHGSTFTMILPPHQAGRNRWGRTRSMT